MKAVESPPQGHVKNIVCLPTRPERQLRRRAGQIERSPAVRRFVDAGPCLRRWKSVFETGRQAVRGSGMDRGVRSLSALGAQRSCHESAAPYVHGPRRGAGRGPASAQGAIRLNPQRNERHHVGLRAAVQQH